MRIIQGIHTYCNTLYKTNHDTAYNKGRQTMVRCECLDKSGYDCDNAASRHTPAASKIVSLFKPHCQSLKFWGFEGIHGVTYYRARKKPTCNDSANAVRRVDETQHIVILLCDSECSQKIPYFVCVPDD